MQYRNMPKSPDRISALSFGCMRFPVTADGKIDEALSFNMLHHAYNNGVNYFDTAWPYHGGESEPFLGRFLQQIDRSKVFVATKLPCWLINTREDMETYLDKQLDRLQTTYIDYYLLHALNRRTWANLKKLGVISFLEEAKKQGKIRHIGFSFHDASPVFRKIATAYDWDFCQIMLNYLDTHYQAGITGYNLAVSRGMGVISMEPLRGGKLVSPIPEAITKIWQRSTVKQNPQERAMRWVWNLSGCTTLLSGMSSMQQLQENLAQADVWQDNNLTEAEIKLYKRVRREYIKRIPILCSECRYCLPCPANVAIPSVFGVYNEAVMFDNKEKLKGEYRLFVPEASRAGKCTKCGACLSKCPHKLDIPTHMETIAAYFGE